MSQTLEQAVIREHFGLRVGSEMAMYACRQAQCHTGSQAIAVMASDARTGKPLQCQLPAQALRDALGRLAERR